MAGAGRSPKLKSGFLVTFVVVLLCREEFLEQKLLRGCPTMPTRVSSVRRLLDPESRHPGPFSVGNGGGRGTRVYEPTLAG